jgi:IS30 family transposase
MPLNRSSASSVRWDQGTEMARHLDIVAKLRTRVYFCDSRSPWRRGSNENTNGLLRQYFPKGTDLAVHTPRHLRAVEDELNRSPRSVLDDRAPAALFNALPASSTGQVLRRQLESAAMSF